MTSDTIEDRNTFKSLFDAELETRHRGDFKSALDMCQRILARIPSNQPVWRALVSGEAGYVCKCLGLPQEAVEYLRCASSLLPTSEHASLSYFLGLWNVGMRNEALHEAIRFLEISSSQSYALLFESSGYGDEFEGELRELLLDAKDLIARRRALI